MCHGKLQIKQHKNVQGKKIMLKEKKWQFCTLDRMYVPKDKKQVNKLQPQNEKRLTEGHHNQVTYK